MKKIMMISAVLFTLVLTACDPSVETFDNGKPITEADLDGKVSAKAFVLNGVKTNKIILENNAACLSSWDYGMGLSSKAYDEVLVTSTGIINVIFTGLNPDGSKISKTIPVEIDAVVYEVTGMDKFIGDGSKTWVFDEFTNERNFSGDGVYPYGIGGGGTDKSPAWWGLMYGAFDEWDATMTFSLDGGAIFQKTLANGTVEKGTFSFDLTKKIGSWSTGILYLNGASIPHPVSMNNGGGTAYQFYILELEDDQLILANQSGNGVSLDVGSNEVNIWMFRPEGWTSSDNTAQMEAISGGSSRTWGWADGACWGNNGLNVAAPGWWTMDAAGLNGQQGSEGGASTMTFNIDGTMLLKNASTGAEIPETYKINMGKGIESPAAPGGAGLAWPSFGPNEDGLGILTVSDHILAGFSPNQPGKPNVKDYQIVKLSDTEMVLGHNWDGVSPDQGDQSGVGWYWVFKALD